jgi:hypothetical protein
VSPHKPLPRLGLGPAFQGRLGPAQGLKPKPAHHYSPAQLEILPHKKTVHTSIRPSSSQALPESSRTSTSHPGSPSSYQTVQIPRIRQNRTQVVVRHSFHRTGGGRSAVYKSTRFGKFEESAISFRILRQLWWCQSN